MASWPERAVPPLPHSLASGPPRCGPASVQPYRLLLCPLWGVKWCCRDMHCSLSHSLRDYSSGLQTGLTLRRATVLDIMQTDLL